ncbi:MAG: hypothetical protein R3F14_37670 [Polyangiaceae bacterium]
MRLTLVNPEDEVEEAISELRAEKRAHFEDRLSRLAEIVGTAVRLGAPLITRE